MHEPHLDLSGSFRVAHYAVLNVILYAFYEQNGGKLTLILIFIHKTITNDVQDDVMRDAK